MGQQPSECIIGIDVSKNRLDIFEWDTVRSYAIDNEAGSIEEWLKGLTRPMRVAIEPTNDYHVAVAERAHECGHAVYLIDPFRLSHYRSGVGQRVKADAQDAQLLARYLLRESDELPLWKPLSSGQKRFWQLLRRRTTLVRSRVQLKQSLTDLGVLQADVEELIRHCETMIRKIDQALLAEARSLGWEDGMRRLQQIPGVGPLTSMALIAVFNRGNFTRVDSFIAFMGMDVRVRQSGQWRGQSKLTKKGDPEVRRLLFNAAMQGRRSPVWEPYYLRLRARGFSSTAAFVALGRKLARVGFALMQKDAEFDPELHGGACAGT
jgi:transposase